MPARGAAINAPSLGTAKGGPCQFFLLKGGKGKEKKSFYRLISTGTKVTLNVVPFPNTYVKAKEITALD